MRGGWTALMTWLSDTQLLSRTVSQSGFLRKAQYLISSVSEYNLCSCIYIEMIEVTRLPVNIKSSVVMVPFFFLPILIVCAPNIINLKSSSEILIIITFPNQFLTLLWFLRLHLWTFVLFQIWEEAGDPLMIHWHLWEGLRVGLCIPKRRFFAPRLLVLWVW